MQACAGYCAASCRRAGACVRAVPAGCSAVAFPPLRYSCRLGVAGSWVCCCWVVVAAAACCGCSALRLWRARSPPDWVLLGLTVAVCPCQLTAASHSRLSPRIVGVVASVAVYLRSTACLSTEWFTASTGVRLLQTASCLTDMCMQRYSLLSQFSQHVRIIRIALLRLLVVFGTRFSRLLCLPVLHGTSNCSINSPPAFSRP